MHSQEDVQSEPYLFSYAPVCSSSNQLATNIGIHVTASAYELSNLVIAEIMILWLNMLII